MTEAELDAMSRAADELAQLWRGAWRDEVLQIIEQTEPPIRAALLGAMICLRLASNERDRFMDAPMDAL